MAKNTLVAFAQSKLNEARRQARDAVVNFDIPDDKVLELRENARRAFEELKALDQEAAKRWYDALKFW